MYYDIYHSGYIIYIHIMDLQENSNRTEGDNELVLANY